MPARNNHLSRLQHPHQVVAAQIQRQTRAGREFDWPSGTNIVGVRNSVQPSPNQRSGNPQADFERHSIDSPTVKHQIPQPSQAHPNT